MEFGIFLFHNLAHYFREFVKVICQPFHNLVFFSDFSQRSGTDCNNVLEGGLAAKISDMYP